MKGREEAKYFPEIQRESTQKNDRKSSESG
jgi:hypothetical protein